MAIDSDVVSGAKLLTQCCQVLSRSQNLLIFFDKTISKLMSIVAEGLAVQSTIIFVPVTLQRSNPSEIDLGLITQGSAKEARIILTRLSSSPDCFRFQARIHETLMFISLMGAQ